MRRDRGFSCSACVVHAGLAGLIVLIAICAGCNSEGIHDWRPLDGDDQVIAIDGDQTGDPVCPTCPDNPCIGPDCEDGDDGKSDPPRWPECNPAAGIQKLTFLHVNDLHASYNPDGPGTSPYARLRALYLGIKKENPYTLFTDGGDNYEKGSIAEVLSSGRATREAAFALGVDVRVLGNHDFGWGLEELLAFSRDPHTVTVVSNLAYVGPETQTFGGVPWTTFTIGCVKVGVAGLVTRPWDEQNRQYSEPFYPEFLARYDWEQMAREVVEMHRAEVDLLVLLSHLGQGMDTQIATVVPGVDLILGGHSHTSIREVKQVNGTVIVQTGSTSLWVARLDLAVDLMKGGFTVDRYQIYKNSTTALAADKETQATIERILKTFAPDAFDPVARVSRDATQLEIAGIAATAALEVFGADAALVQEKTVDMTWMAGMLTPQDLLNTFRISRQRPGTPGWNGFYLVGLSGGDVARLQSLDGDGWAFKGNTATLIGPNVTLAVQKFAALHPEIFGLDGLVFDTPVFAMEAWEVVSQYGQARLLAAQAIDE